MKSYAIYKGDEFLCLGTAKECAKQLNVKIQTIYFWNTKTYHERVKNSKNARLAIIVEEG
jgi:hypothetical protein